MTRVLQLHVIIIIFLFRKGSRSYFEWKLFPSILSYAIIWYTAAVSCQLLNSPLGGITWYDFDKSVFYGGIIFEEMNENGKSN